MNHFPGPWRIEGEFDAETRIEIRSADDQLVCEIEPFTDEWTEAEIANVRAIVAVPELLAAARLTVEHFERSDVTGSFLGDEEHESWAVLKQAIAKAEGPQESGPVSTTSTDRARSTPDSRAAKQISYRKEGHEYLLRNAPGEVIRPWPAGRINELGSLSISAVDEAFQNPGKWIDCPVATSKEDPYVSDPS